MNLIPFEHIPIVQHGQSFVHVSYLHGILPKANCPIHYLVTPDQIRLDLLILTAASVVSYTPTFQKLILAPLSDSMYNPTPSPTTISVPAAVYNLGMLCIQWRQNTDGRATVGLCTVCPLAPLDTAHSPIKLHWTQLYWVLEDMWICYSLTGCYRPNIADSLCGITDRYLVTQMFDLSQTYILSLLYKLPLLCSPLSHNINICRTH